MRKNLPLWPATFGMVAALLAGACTPAPYGPTIGGHYSSGYRHSGGGYSTSLFVSTGDPRWGYDPHTHCYYDYRIRRYYDPYLCGYYPVGHRPCALRGVPHPHGWRPGRGACPPPGGVRNATVLDCHDRETAYRNSDYSWARDVRQQPVTGGGPGATFPEATGNGPSQNTQGWSGARPNAAPHDVPSSRANSGLNDSPESPRLDPPSAPSDSPVPPPPPPPEPSPTPEPSPEPLRGLGEG